MVVLSCRRVILVEPGVGTIRHVESTMHDGWCRYGDRTLHAAVRWLTRLLMLWSATAALLVLVVLVSVLIITSLLLVVFLVLR